MAEGPRQFVRYSHEFVFHPYRPLVLLVSLDDKEPVTMPEGSPQPTRSDRMNKGELYEYYKRLGMLEVYFSLYPGG